jgi:predicted transglutaminase-like cysteine proteinase
MNFAELSRVNADINKLPYTSAVDPLWEPINKDDDGGTCSNFAVAKFRELHRLGWPANVLRLACCFAEPSAAAEKRDRYHAVLLADFEGQTWVLDNRYPLPMEAQLLPYEWHKFWNHDLNAWEYATDADRTFL